MSQHSLILLKQFGVLFSFERRLGSVIFFYTILISCTSYMILIPAVYILANLKEACRRPESVQ